MLSFSEMNIEEIIIIWLDENINEHDEYYQNCIIQLRTIVNFVKIYNEPNQCIDFLTDIINKKVFLILSKNLSQILISSIDGISQLDSIYIYSNIRIEHEQWIKNWTKIQGVFTDISSLFGKLKNDIQQCENDLTPMQIISVSSTENLDELACSFMYSQLLKEVLLSIEYNEQTKQQFFDYLRNLYADNQQGLISIKQFEENYANHSPAWWYTKESFIYSILNKALRTQDVQIIINIGFFIQDLHKQIKNIHMKNKPIEKLILYRGQGMSITDFENMKKSEGGLVSFNSFLSTSTDHDISFLFADSSQQKDNTVGVIFIIQIDSSISTIPFASLKDISYYSNNQNTENEILFSMHTVYRIDHINQIDQHLWKINLTLTNDNDIQLKHLTDYVRQEIGDANESRALVPLLIKMGEFNKAEQISRTLFHTASEQSSEELMYFNYNLGSIKQYSGDFTNSLSHFQMAVDIAQQILSPNSSVLALIYNGIAVTYNSIGNYSNALLYFGKALNIQESNLPSKYYHLAATYNNIALVHNSMGYYTKALLFYEKSLEIQKNVLPPIHPNIAITYKAISSVYQNMGRYKIALSYCEKARSICEKSLPSTHPALANCYNSMALVYDKMGDYPTALLFYEKALNIRQKSGPDNVHDMATEYNNVGLTYYAMKDYSMALSYYEKALQIHKKSPIEMDPSLATLYNSLGLVYNSMNNHSKALSYHKQSLEIVQSILPSTHLYLSITYNNIGLVYNAMKDYSTAMIYHKKAFEIQEKSLPSIHPEIAKTYLNIGGSYSGMKNYSTALFYFEKALHIQHKTLPSDHPHLVSTHQKMARAHKSLGRDSDALSCLQKALQIGKETLSDNHFDIATNYFELGTTYFSMMDYSSSLSYLEKAVQIEERVFFPMNSRLGIIYNSIGLTYKAMGDYNKALSYYEKALEIQEKSLPPDDPELIIIYSNIAGVYTSLGNYSTALSYLKNVLEIREKSLPLNDSRLANTNGNIGMTYAQMGEYFTALPYFQKALEIQEQAIPCSPDILASIHNALAQILFGLRRNDEAIFHAKRARDIANDTFGPDHPKTLMFATILQQLVTTVNLSLSLK